MLFIKPGASGERRASSSRLAPRDQVAAASVRETPMSTTKNPLADLAPKLVELTDVARAGTQPSQKGPADYFTGSVRIDPLFQAKESTRASGAHVTFEPGARS